VPRLICKQSGVLNDQPCDAFDKTSWACTAEVGKCELQVPHLTKEEEASHIRVPVSGHAERIANELQVRIELFKMLSDDVYQPIKEALSLIEKMSPLGKEQIWNVNKGEKVQSLGDMHKYWENIRLLDFDMGQLSALLSHISVLAARMESDYKRAERARELAKAQKYSAIKEMFASGIRARRPGEKLPTEAELKNLVVADQQIQDAYNLELRAQEAMLVFRAFAKSVDDHINVIKKRIESSRTEFRNAGREGG
jgi:hypothetical protein